MSADEKAAAMAPLDMHTRDADVAAVERWMSQPRHAHVSADERIALRALSDAIAPIRARSFDDLDQVAARLYPDNPPMQAEWKRAVEVVRSTSRGWALDTPICKQERRHAREAG